MTGEIGVNVVVSDGVSQKLIQNRLDELELWSVVRYELVRTATACNESAKAIQKLLTRKTWNAFQMNSTSCKASEESNPPFSADPDEEWMLALTDMRSGETKIGPM